MSGYTLWTREMHAEVETAVREILADDCWPVVIESRAGVRVARLRDVDRAIWFAGIIRRQGGSEVTVW